MKYLIYKGTGGLVHMLNGLQRAIDICKNENRILIIDTKVTTPFKHKFSDFFFIFDKDLIYYSDYKYINKDLKFYNLTVKDIIRKKAMFCNDRKKYYLQDTQIFITLNKDNNYNNEIFSDHIPLKVKNPDIDEIYSDEEITLYDNKYKNIYKNNVDKDNVDKDNVDKDNVDKDNVDKDNVDDDMIKICAGSHSSFLKNIRLKTNIMYKIFDLTIDTIELYKTYISVHFRNTDMKNSIQDFINKIKITSQKFNIKNIYIATDDHYAFDIFKNSLQDLNFFRLTKPDYYEGKNIHYHCKNRKQIIFNILIDIYMIINSTYFIPSINSGVSKWIIHQKYNEDYAIFDDNYNFEVIK